MRRVIFLGIITLLCMAFNLFVSCSNPLDYDNLTPSDTLFSIDTVYNMDTINVSDTINIIDTTSLVDTVIIVINNNDQSNIVCSRIASNQQEIVWLFRNDAGMYDLEFAAAAEEDFPAQKLVIDIDGQEFKWTPAEDPEFIAGMYLTQNAIIRLSIKTPRSLGHAIYVCLTLKPAP